MAAPARRHSPSSRWYREVLGCASGHGGSEYERLVDNGELEARREADRILRPFR